MEHAGVEVVRAALDELLEERAGQRRVAVVHRLLREPARRLGERLLVSQRLRALAEALERVRVRGVLRQDAREDLARRLGLPRGEEDAALRL